MATQDLCCSIHPYFRVHDGQLDAFKSLCEQFVDRTSQEKDCLYYGFSFDGNLAHCREAYSDAEALLTHASNVSDLIEEALKLADVTRIELHGPAAELEKLREPLSKYEPQYFVLEYGFRK